jgi:predicted nucleic acid-binding protein
VIVARVIVLDSGPLGDACRRRGNPVVEGLTTWWIHGKANGAIIAVPEIADYEIRRSLLLTGATDGIERLERLRKELEHYIPISTAAMRRAADLWADARKKGISTANDNEIDADVILAAQAMLFTGLRDSLTVATYNARHLSRYVDACHWEEIIF